jgi:hypothetical protein
VAKVGASNTDRTISLNRLQCLLANNNACNKSRPYTGLDSPLGPKKVEATRISRKPAHQGENVVGHTHRPPLPPSKYTW